MTERTVDPCPACGGAGILVFEPSPGGVLWHVHCESDACLVGERQPEASEALASWARLSRAARLARALDTVLARAAEDTRERDEATSVMLVPTADGWAAELTWWHHDGPIPERESVGATPEEALTRLADEVAP